MTAQFARAPQRGHPGGTEPHAALLIDFDNVTMGIRSDLTRELKSLLNSDIIKGKVAVQRAYADWRRYPQYIVPLAESSVDLIFAPAYGSAKKNATDIRLAIDATELVFTRPEIGTIILLSGDSDFSSLVLKLKEYGKYVIGVGIRESASDLLVQNCDEYYSYSALTGLTRTGEEADGAAAGTEDPWEMVEVAVRRMVENNDVMRSDRLKQVLLELDPGFDEKSLGFQKFNRFLQAASTRGLLSLRKQENGQYEIAAGTGESDTEAAAADTRESRRGRGRRGRGGRRDEPRQREDAASAAAAPESGAAEPTEAAGPAAEEREPRREREKAAAAEAPRAEQQAERPAAGAGGAPAEGAAEDGLAAAYELLRRATADMAKKPGQGARDSDVKRRILELESGWDESSVGFSKFSRFLRKAHDDSVISLRQGENGSYDVLPGGEEPETEADAAPRSGRGERGRGRQGRERGGRTAADDAASARPAQAATAGGEAGGEARGGGRRAEEPTAKPAATDGATEAARAPAAAVGFRRGSRGRAAPSGPPPLLEGQTTPAVKPVSGAAAGGRAEQGEKKAPAKKAAAKRTAAKKSTAKKSPGKKAAAKKAPSKKSTAKSGAKKSGGRGARFDAAALGLPDSAGDIATYMTRYRGVGPKSVQTLIETFGAGKVFEVLETQPDRVREVIGGARGDRLLKAWSEDVRARRGGSAGG